MPTPGSFSRILVILLAPIGDTLFATPVLRALRQHYPQAYLAALVYAPSRDILAHHPDLDELFLHPPWPSLRRWGELLPVLRRLRRCRFELTVDLSPLTWFLSRVVCAALRRLTLPLPRLWWLFSRSHSPWLRTHAVDLYLRALEPLGISPQERCPRLYLSPEDRAFAGGFLRERGEGQHRLLVALHPGGEGLGGKKRWGPEGFAWVGDALVEREGAVVLLVGSPTEVELAQGVAARMRQRPLSLVGQLSLGQTAALLERCHLLVGNDSAPLHMAAALGVPTVAPFGPSNPANFAPRGEGSVVLRHPLPCAPCFSFVGGAPLWQRPGCLERYCLAAISPQEVLEAAQRLLLPHLAPEPLRV